MGLALSLKRDKLRFDRAEWKLKSIPGGKKGMRDFPGGPVVRTQIGRASCRERV